MNPVKLGVVGCGAIAQVHHLPNLHDLHGLFQVNAVCDVSAGAAAYVADKFSVPSHFTDYRDLLASDIEAVLLCQSDPKTEVAVAALDAGKHLFIEKPMCFSLQEADAIIAAQQRSGKVGQVGYMKIFDPAYEYAKREVDTMETIRFVQVNHLHPNNDLHTRQFDIRRFDDIPADAMAATRAARQAARQQAVGDVPPHVERTFYLLSGSMIHDLYGMRTMLGVPNKIASTDIWFDGRAVTMTLEYPNGARCVATWVDLPDLWDFQESLEIYGDNKRVIVEYPTGFARGPLSKVTIQGIDANGTTYKQEPAIDWETAFSREMRHFYDCVRNGAPCRAPVASARDDIALIIDIIKCYQAQAPLERQIA
ncbi:MAG: Gfo/Idh/MocA family oxidoreductase [Caldilineaceae bacterium]